MTNNGDTTPDGQPGPYGAPDPNQPGTNQPGATPPAYGAPQYGDPATPPPPPAYGSGQYGDPYGQTAPGGAGYGSGGGYGTGGGFGPQPFDVGAAVKYGWAKFQQNVGPILIFVVCYFVVSIIVSFVASMLGTAIGGGSSQFTFDAETGEFANTSGFLGGNLVASLVQNLITTVVSIIGQAVITKGALDITHGRQLTLGSLFSGYDWGQVLIAAILISVATSIGLVLCILPGVAVMFLTWFSFYFIIDKQMSAIDGIKASFNLIKDNVGSVLILALACVGLYIAGFVACCVGLLVAMPVAVIATAYGYRTLQGEPVAP